MKLTTIMELPGDDFSHCHLMSRRLSLCYIGRKEHQKPPCAFWHITAACQLVCKHYPTTCRAAVKAKKAKLLLSKYMTAALANGFTEAVSNH